MLLQAVPFVQGDLVAVDPTSASLVVTSALLVVTIRICFKLIASCYYQ